MRSKSGPGSTIYRYGFCEVAQRQAVFVRKNKSSDRVIKSYRAKVVMTAGCISKTFDISNYIYILREIANSANQNKSANHNEPLRRGRSSLSIQSGGVIRFTNFPLRETGIIRSGNQPGCGTIYDRMAHHQHRHNHTSAGCRESPTLHSLQAHT